MGSLLHLPERCGLNRISCNLNQEHVCMNLAYFQLNLRFYDRSHVDGRLYANRDERVGLVDRARSLLASRLAHIIIIIIRSSSSSSRSSSSTSSPYHDQHCRFRTSKSFALIFRRGVGIVGQKFRLLKLYLSTLSNGWINHSEILNHHRNVGNGIVKSWELDLLWNLEKGVSPSLTATLSQ